MGKKVYSSSDRNNYLLTTWWQSFMLILAYLCVNTCILCYNVSLPLLTNNNLMKGPLGKKNTGVLLVLEEVLNFPLQGKFCMNPVKYTCLYLELWWSFGENGLFSSHTLFVDSLTSLGGVFILDFFHFYTTFVTVKFSLLGHFGVKSNFQIGDLTHEHAFILSLIMHDQAWFNIASKDTKNNHRTFSVKVNLWMKLFISYYE